MVAVEVPSDDARCPLSHVTASCLRGREARQRHLRRVAWYWYMHSQCQVSMVQVDPDPRRVGTWEVVASAHTDPGTGSIASW